MLPLWAFLAPQAQLLFQLFPVLPLTTLPPHLSPLLVLTRPLLSLVAQLPHLLPQYQRPLLQTLPILWQLAETPVPQALLCPLEPRGLMAFLWAWLVDCKPCKILARVPTSFLRKIFN